jgi:hypothetical protein
VEALQERKQITNHVICPRDALGRTVMSRLLPALNEGMGNP